MAFILKTYECNLATKNNPKPFQKQSKNNGKME